MTPASRRPTRLTQAGRTYLDLQRAARAGGRDTAELLQMYALEGFLARLSASTYCDQLVLKGGLLLAAYGARRPTRDIDIAARAVDGELEHVLGVARQIAMADLGDGLSYDHAGAAAHPIREEAEYGGVRVTMPCRLDRARLRFHLDVNFGEPIWPSARLVQLPRLLGGSLEVLSYPMAMVLAEKIVTAVQRGQANTRWRDFADIYLLSQLHDHAGSELTAAVRRVAEHRHAQLWALATTLDGYAARSQRQWAIWLRRQQLEDRLPEDIIEVIDLVVRFGDPVIDGTAATMTWSRPRWTWFP